jgi:hypothetical protein
MMSDALPNAKAPPASSTMRHGHGSRSVRAIDQFWGDEPSSIKIAGKSDFEKNKFLLFYLL